MIIFTSIKKTRRFEKLEIFHKIIIKHNLNKYLKALWETFLAVRNVFNF